MSTIHPIIFLSISEVGSEIIDTIKKESKKLHDSLTQSRYVRYIGIDKHGNINNCIDDTIVNVSLAGDINKLDDYINFNQKRLEIKAVFEKIINSVYNLDNINYAAEKNLTIGRPQIVILGSFDFPAFSPFVISLLQSFDTFSFKDGIKPQLHLILIYNSKLQSDNSSNTSLLKNSFLKELESAKISKPFVWLIDIINEKSINLNSSSTVYYSISQFADLLYTSASVITAPATTMVEFREKDKPCMYSTFGYSIMHFPSEKIKEYIKIHASDQEFNLILNDFNSKFEIITIKDETTKFFRKFDFENIPLKISKKSNFDEIYIPLSYDKFIKHYDLEYENVLSKKLSLVENPTVISVTNSNDFFHQLEVINKKYEDDVFINYSSELDSSKKRELQNIIQTIHDTQIAFLDDKEKGINYSILFGAMLCNNQASVQSMLEGRFVENIPSLNNLQDIYRGSFIGDQVQENQKLLNSESDNSTNKGKLIEEYKEKLELAQQNLNSIHVVDPEIENPKVKELEVQINDFNRQISKLTEEINIHNTQIEKFTKKIQKVKNDFDQVDPRKEIYRIKRNELVLTEIESLRNSKIPEHDKLLSEDYNNKNIKLENRKKFIFWKLLIVPIAFFLSFFSLELYFSYNGLLPSEWFFDIFVVILSIVIVYYIIFLRKFYLINKDLNEFLSEVQTHLSEKKNLLSKYLELKNKVHFNNFSFETDLISFYMVEEIIKKVKTNQQFIESFKERLLSSKENFANLKNQFSFNNSPFEFCIISKAEIENIYNSSVKSKIVNRIEGDVNLSSCFRNYIETDNLNYLMKPIEDQALDIFERKIENESISTILFNESPNFAKNINTGAKFNQIIETSRPLLRTSIDVTVSSPDIPYTQNIIVGKYDKKFESYLSSIKFGDINIDETNQNAFGIISIKSNFPAFLIYDVISNEEILRNTITKDNQSKYFINESALTYSIVPSLNLKSIDKGVLGNPLIASIVNKDIIFNANTNQFENAVLGALGFTFEELITMWNTNLCFDLNQSAIQLENEIWSLDDDELSLYLTSFAEIWTNLQIGLPSKFEDELSTYYFSLKGTSSGWDSIIKNIKSKRKTLLNKNR
jgi:hypothetical protein